MRMEFAAKALIVKSDKYLAMHKKSAPPEKYELPGGRSEFGETPEDTVVRELQEETGLPVTPVRLLDTWTYVAGDYQVTGVIYLCDAPADAEVRLSDEHDDWQWFALGDYRKMAGCYARRMIRWDTSAF